MNTNLSDIELAGLKKIGHITPSSNTALEPITAAMNATLVDRVSHHFTRITVKKLTTDASTASQFEFATMMSAAELLAHCNVDAIVWNGTSASWLGVERDQELCRQIECKTKVKASTSTLAFFDSFRACKLKRIALAVPYKGDVTKEIAKVYGQHGFEVLSESHLDQTVNTDIGSNPRERIRKLLRDSVSQGGVEAIAVVCTNLAGTPLVDEMERELGIPIIDSIAVTFWQACRLAGVKSQMKGWGALMDGSLEK